MSQHRLKDRHYQYIFKFVWLHLLWSRNEQQIYVILKKHKRGVTHKIKVKFIVEQQTPHIQQTGQGKTNNVDKTKSKNPKLLFFGLALPYKNYYGTTKVHT